MSLQYEQLKNREDALRPTVHLLSSEQASFGDYSYERRFVEVVDPTLDLAEVERMRREGDYWEDQIVRHPEWQPPVPDPLNPGRLIIPSDNLAALWLYRDWEPEANEGSMEQWASRLFPTALALYPLQRIGDGGRVLPGGVIDARSRYLFTHMVDGIGLRNRAAVYANSLGRIGAKANGDRLKVVSLGSGAGVPNADATELLESKGKAIDWSLYDIDTRSLYFSEELFKESLIRRSTFDYGPRTEEGELIGRRFTQAFKDIDPQSVDVADALGLWEYLSAESATLFAQKAYSLVKPGGSLIVSNMLPSRPQREFNQRAVGWPGLYLCSETDLLEIVTAAGVDTQNVSMTHSTDGVYVVMEIKRPL